MTNSTNISVVLAIVFFIVPIAVKFCLKQKSDLSLIMKCTLAAIGLPNLSICLYKLVFNFNMEEVMRMPEAPQYLTIALLLAGYVAVEEISKVFTPPPPGSDE